MEIDDDITRARTPSGALYRDPAIFARMRERIFARTWQVAADAERVSAPGQTWPCLLMPDFLDEPLLFSRDASGALHALSNVCTHRANLVCTEPAAGVSSLRCRYHGRRFSIDGRFQSMPEFSGATDFPSPADDLPRVPWARLGPLLFAALEPAFSFWTLIAPIASRLDALGIDRLTADPSGTRDYHVRAHWALYCDNYLEGFHIPYVHPELNTQLDFGEYRTELFPYGTLQVGVARDGEEAFDALDGGRRVAGYYFWLFPNTMLNFYPWGLSLNIVTPIDLENTRVSYRAWVLDGARRGRGAGAALELVEQQDEAIVEQAQRGVRARLYRGGRYSPARETGVHHFHRLLAQFLNA